MANRELSEIYLSALHYVQHIGEILCQQDYKNKVFILERFGLGNEDFKGLLFMLNNKVPCLTSVEKIK